VLIVNYFQSFQSPLHPDRPWLSFSVFNLQEGYNTATRREEIVISAFRGGQSYSEDQSMGRASDDESSSGIEVYRWGKP
jgi:hypothetical protein